MCELPELLRSVGSWSGSPAARRRRMQCGAGIGETTRVWLGLLVRGVMVRDAGAAAPRQPAATIAGVCIRIYHAVAISKGREQILGLLEP